MLTNLTPDQQRKVDSLLVTGSAELEKIKAIREALNESIKAVADDINVKPKDLRNAMKIAHKQNYAEYNEDYENVQAILELTGRGANE